MESRIVFRALFDDPAFPSIRIFARSSGLHSYLDVLEEFVPLIQAQVTVRFSSDLKRQGFDARDSAVSEDIGDLQILTEHHIAGNLHGAFVLALFAELETSMRDLAEYVREKERTTLSLSDLREPSILRRLTLYIETVLREPLLIPARIQNELEELRLVRNILAHANGSLADQPQDRRKKVTQLAQRKRTIVIDDDCMLVQPAFLRENLENVDAYLEAVLAQLDRKYPVTATKPR